MVNLQLKPAAFQNKSVLTFGILVALSSFFLWIVFPFGPGISDDSLLYLECGNHLFSGQGFTVIGHNGNLVFAADRFPVYPILLRTFTLPGIQPLVFQFLLFIAFSFLVMKALKTFAPEGNPLVVVLIALLACLYPFVLVFYNLWTEGVFLILLLCILILFHSGKNIRLLFVLLVLLSLTRMVGMTIGFSIAVVWFLNKENSKAIAALICSTLPVAAWAFAGFVFGDENSRQLSMHPVTNKMIHQFFTTLGSLFVSEAPWKEILGVAMFLLPAALSIKMMSSKSGGYHSILLLTILYYVYPLFLLLSLSFLDHSTMLDNRILAPEFLILIFILFYFLSRAKSNSNAKVAQLLLFIMLSLAVHVKDYKKLRSNGYGFTSKLSHEFSFNDAINRLPKNSTWYSNSIHGLYYQTGKIPYELPFKFDIHTNKSNNDYVLEWEKKLKEIKKNSGIIIWIRSGAFEKVFISYEELKNTAGLSVLYDDGLCLVMSSK